MAVTVAVPARRGGEELAASLRFEVGEPCWVEVELSDGERERGEGLDLFDALVAVRRPLEMRDVLLACNGARRDVYPSQMLRQASQGRRAYVLGERGASQQPPSVDIFAATDWEAIATIDSQRAAFEDWVGPPPPGWG